MKTVCCDINEDLPHPVYGRLFYHGVSPLWCKWHTLFCVVQRCSNISLMGLLDEIMLNLQLYRKICLFYNGLWVVKLFICLVCSCITYVLERTWWVHFLVYISHSCRIYMLLQLHEDFIHLCICTNHFYKAFGLYSHVDRYCSLYVLHLMCVVYVELYCGYNDNFSHYLHCTVLLLEDYWLERGMEGGWNLWYGELGVEGVVTFHCTRGSQ